MHLIIALIILCFIQHVYAGYTIQEYEVQNYELMFKKEFKGSVSKKLREKYAELYKEKSKSAGYRKLYDKGEYKVLELGVDELSGELSDEISQEALEKVESLSLEIKQRLELFLSKNGTKEIHFVNEWMDILSENFLMVIVEDKGERHAVEDKSESSDFNASGGSLHDEMVQFSVPASHSTVNESSDVMRSGFLFFQEPDSDNLEQLLPVLYFNPSSWFAINKEPDEIMLEEREKKNLNSRMNKRGLFYYCLGCRGEYTHKRFYNGREAYNKHVKTHTPNDPEDFLEVLEKW